jgi:hypothetical protein
MLQLWYQERSSIFQLFLGKHSLKESFDWKSALAEEAEDRTFPSHVLVN